MNVRATNPDARPRPRCRWPFLGCFDGGPAQAPTPGTPAVRRAPAAGRRRRRQRPANGPTSQAQGEDQAVEVTPDRRVDPKKLIDVVKEEIKGGEAERRADPAELPLAARRRDARSRTSRSTVKPPLGLEPIAGKVPLANPLTKGKVELGKQLYFDPRISQDGTVSCATCHNPEKGWTDNLDARSGSTARSAARNAPTVLNTVYGQTMFWDGRRPLARRPGAGPAPEPDRDGQAVVQGDHRAAPDDPRLPRAVPEGLRHRRHARRHGQGDRRLRAGRPLGQLGRMTSTTAATRPSRSRSCPTARSGAWSCSASGSARTTSSRPASPLKKADCTSCHAGFNFTDEQFHNLGVGWDDKESKFADLGRFVIAPIGAKNPADLGAFKTPTVRDVARTAPYMHDGSLKTLEEVVEHYNKGGNPNPTLDKDMKKLNLTAQEKADVVEFMKALTGEAIKVALPTLPPGPDGKSPDPRAALTPAGPKTAATRLGPRRRSAAESRTGDPRRSDRRPAGPLGGAPGVRRARAAVLRWRPGRSPRCPSSIPIHVGASGTSGGRHRCLVLRSSGRPRSGCLRPGRRLLRPGDRGAAVRLPRRRALLLPALPAGPGRVGRRPVAALGARGERRDAAAGQPDGRRALSRKLIYRALPYPLAARLYVVAHTLLAFGGMLVLRGRWGSAGRGRRSRGSRYAFGGPILFQYCNIIYLVGAAWVPWGSRRSTAGSGSGSGGRRRAGGRAGDAGARRRPAVGLPRRALRPGSMPSLLAPGRGERRRPMARAWSVAGAGARRARRSRPGSGMTLGLARLPAARSGPEATAPPPTLRLDPLPAGGRRGLLGAGGARSGPLAGGSGRPGRVRPRATSSAGLAAAAGLAGRSAGGPAPAGAGVHRPERAGGRRGVARHLPVQPRALPGRSSCSGRTSSARSSTATGPGSTCAPRDRITGSGCRRSTSAAATSSWPWPGSAVRGGPAWRGWMAGIAVVSLLGELRRVRRPALGGAVVRAVIAAASARTTRPTTNAIRLDGHLRDGDGSVYWIALDRRPRLPAVPVPEQAAHVHRPRPRGPGRATAGTGSSPGAVGGADRDGRRPCSA